MMRRPGGSEQRVVSIFSVRARTGTVATRWVLLLFIVIHVTKRSFFSLGGPTSLCISSLSLLALSHLPEREASLATRCCSPKKILSFCAWQRMGGSMGVAAEYTVGEVSSTGPTRVMNEI